MAGVLETLATFTEAGTGRVEFFAGKPGKPLYLKAINPDGLNVESVVMPLMPEKGQDERRRKGDSERCRGYRGCG